MDGLSKVAPFLAAGFAILMFWVAILLIVVGISAMSDGYWSVGF